MKHLLLLVLITVAIACNDQKGWTEDNKLSYIQSCISDNRGTYGTEQAKNYCECVQEKVQREYPDYRDAEKISMSQNTRIADSCLPGGWAENEKQVFMETCTDKRISMGDERPEAVSYCDCMMRKIQAKYPDILTAENIPDEEMTSMARECIAGRGTGDGNQ